MDVDMDVIEEATEIIAKGCGCDRHCQELVGADVYCGCRDDAVKVIELAEKACELRALVVAWRDAERALEKWWDEIDDVTDAAPAYRNYLGAHAGLQKAVDALVTYADTL